jgi:hypothetical protein
MFEGIDIFVQVQMVNRVVEEETDLLRVNATTSKILNYIFTETKPKCALTRDASTITHDDNLYKFVLSVCECAEYLDSTSDGLEKHSANPPFEPMLYLVYFASLRTGICVQNEEIPVCVWNYFKDIKLYTNIPRSLEPVVGVFLQEWETLSYQQIERKLDTLASLISEEKASSDARPLRGKLAPIPHGQTKNNPFNSDTDITPTDQALRDSERQKVITYIKSQYTVTGKNDVVNRIKFNELAAELENALYIPKEKSVVFRNKLSCYLTSPTIGLSKKRYTDGIYYYGIKRKEVAELDTVEEEDTCLDEPILTHLGSGDAHHGADTICPNAEGTTKVTTASDNPFHESIDTLFPSFTQMESMTSFHL